MLRCMKLEHCINLMYMPHLIGEQHKIVVKTVCFAGKMMHCVVERYKL
jgi:hypothetical protein